MFKCSKRCAPMITWPLSERAEVSETPFRVAVVTKTRTRTMANISPRPPLLPWSAKTWERWSAQGRLSSTPVPRTPFLLLKAPLSTVYEEKIGGDKNMFTGMGILVRRPLGHPCGAHSLIFVFLSWQSVDVLQSHDGKKHPSRPRH